MKIEWQIFCLLLWTLGFLYLVIRIEGYFIYKSIERFKELKQAYDALQASKKELKNTLDK